MKGFLFIICLCLMQACHTQEKTNMMQNELITAVEKSDINFLKSKLNADNVNTANAKKQSLLMIATYDNNYKVAELLVQKGANPNTQDDILNSPFLYAGAAGYVNFAQLFLKNGARFDVFNRYYGSALIPAAEKGHVEMVRMLANTKGYPVNHVNKLGWTALMEAVVLGSGGKAHTDIVKILLDAGADKNIPDNDGVTALQHARKKGFKSIEALLQ